MSQQPSEVASQQNMKENRREQPAPSEPHALKKKGKEREEKDLMSIFNCYKCKDTLFGKRFVKVERRPWCVTCYNDKFSYRCVKCSLPIGVDASDIQYQEDHWHAECFHCSKCDVELFGRTFGLHEMAAFCADCYNEMFRAWCPKCRSPFKGGSKQIAYQGEHIHKECFKCTHCSIALEVDEYREMLLKPYCSECYIILFTKKCHACTHPIRDGQEGVLFRENPYHENCLLCHACKIPLNKTRFVEFQDKLHCFICFEDKTIFGRNCAACDEKISTSEENEFFSLEENSWHKKCFKCSRCHEELNPEFICARDGERTQFVYCELCGEENYTEMMSLLRNFNVE